MPTANLVTLQNHEEDTNDMYWQSDKNDFVDYEDWKMELHDRTDYANAIFKFNEEKYYGEVCFEHSEITAFELSRTNTK